MATGLCADKSFFAFSFSHFHYKYYLCRVNQKKAVEKNRLNVAFIGLGDRGRTAVRLMSAMPAVRVVALCDGSAANLESARQYAEASTECVVGSDAYAELCRRADVDLVYVCTGWESHAPIALAALRGGKHVAVEVPAALTLDDIRELVAASRASGRHCFMLENCCFDEQLLDATERIRNGEIGEVVHAEGSYYHELADRWTPWRLEINRRQRGDLYPTHEIGPICKALGIGVSDELETLVCMDSAPFVGRQVYERALRREAPDFVSGDHTTTIIRTRRGRTIVLRHDVMTSQPYERQLTFIGTRGRITINDAGKASHDVMTADMNRHLVDALLNGKPSAISLKDMAAWSAIVPLSALSIQKGFAPIAFPNFEI